MRSLLEFIFPHRLHRLAYFVRGIAADCVMGFLYSYISVTHSKIWWLAITAILVYGTFFITLPRMRDLSMSNWWLLAYFVPIPIVSFWLGVILLFRAPDMVHPKSDAPLQPAAASP